MPVRVRRSRPADADRVAAMARELNRLHGDPLDRFTPAVVRRDADRTCTILVAEDGGALVGYALFHEAYEPAQAMRGIYLCDLWVEPAARRHGTGRALVAAVAAAARRRRLRYVWWVSRRWNRAAQAFYRTLGAVEEPVVAHALFDAAFARLADASSPRSRRTAPRRVR